MAIGLAIATRHESRGQHKGRYYSSWLFFRTMRYSLRRALSLDSVDGCTHKPNSSPVARSFSQLCLRRVSFRATILWKGNGLSLADRAPCPEQKQEGQHEVYTIRHRDTSVLLALVYPQRRSNSRISKHFWHGHSTYLPPWISR